MLFTPEEALWLDYLEIDEETRERKLREDTPEEIRLQYEEYLLAQEQMGLMLTEEIPAEESSLAEHAEQSEQPKEEASSDE